MLPHAGDRARHSDGAFHAGGRDRRGAPGATVNGLIVLSHGTGGIELGLSSLAEALARSGYPMAALRHPGDNWQDGSLLRGHADRCFDERPRQVTRVIDAIPADPRSGTCACAPAWRWPLSAWC